VNGTPQWNGTACEVLQNGKYVTTIPVRAHYEGEQHIPQADQQVRLIRPDGNEYEFHKDYIAGSVIWMAETPGTSISLDQVVTYLPSAANPDVEERVITYLFTDENNIRETYSSEGQLLNISYLNGITETLTYVDERLHRVENSLGNSIAFTYNPDGSVATISEDSGRIWQYAYDAGRLVKVVNPDATEKNYHYENPELDYALTGLTDERSVRYSTFDYYPDGLAMSSYLGAPGMPAEQRIEDVSLIYGDTFNKVINSRGYESKYHFSSDVLQGLLTQYDGPECANCAGGSKSYHYDLEKLNLLGKTAYGQSTTFENHDGNGNPGVVTEAVGTPEQRTTAYTYDSRHQNKVATKTGSSVYPGGNKVTTYRYDDFGNTTSIIINGYRPDGTPVSRTQTFSYSGPYHQLSAIDGPRTDVDDMYVIDYYPDDVSEGYNRGRMRKVTAPLGVPVYDNINYTATGKPASYLAGSNLKFDFTYYPGNDRLETRTLTDLTSGEIRMTHWSYLTTGEVESIAQGYATPEATTLTFEYDDARRLTRVYDGFNNYIEYVLDTEGNVISENIHDQAGILLKALDQSYDAHNRLDISTQANETRNQDFSPDGTLDLEKDGKSVVTDYSYDALRRLTSITQDLGGTDPASANALTQFGYDVQDNLVSVTDPNGGQTSYVYDDLGNLLSLTSTDTGTSVYTHDDAGNVTTMTDARGQVFNYSYDALGRVMLADAPGTSDDISYVYDSCENGAGRLCSVSRDSVTVSYSYSAFGDITSLIQTVATFPSYEQAIAQVSYTYDAAGRIRDMLYPSGNKVTYTYDAAGNVYSVILNDTEKNLVVDAQYYPFGPERLVNRDNGSSIFGYLDQAYRTWIIGNGGYFYDVVYHDENGNPATFYSSEGSKNHSYDALDRLDASTGPYGSRGYGYDSNGNRVTRRTDGMIDNNSYDPDSNRMNTNAGTAVVLDANGSTTSLYGMALNYTADNRLAGITGRADYSYNGLGERAMKGLRAPGTAGTYGFKFKTVYLYDHDGQLLAELGPSGKVKQEYVYLNNELLTTIVYQPGGGEAILNADMDADGAVGVDDYLIWYFNHYNTRDLTRDVNNDGMLDTNDANLVLSCALSGGTATDCMTDSYSRMVYYAHNDHLGTTHMLSDENGVSAWSAVYDPFGQVTVNDDLDGDGRKVTFNQRFPGQYYDAESGLHYNYHRYYDPETGRYITSDPIGLDGGLNTFGYVGQNPIKYIDPTGELFVVGGGVGFVIGGVSGFVGTLVTGGDINSALVAGTVGGMAGAYIGATGGIGIVQAGILGSTTNITGQVISNNTDDDMCNNSDINWGSVIGSGLGGMLTVGLTGWMTGVTGQVAAGEISFMIETGATGVGANIYK
jgi:RHS repeat-associated protein